VGENTTGDKEKSENFFRAPRGNRFLGAIRLVKGWFIDREMILRLSEDGFGVGKRTLLQFVERKPIKT